MLNERRVAGGLLIVLGAVAVLEARRLSALREEMVAGAVVVPFTAGGGGVIGARAALKEATPDGYTVLVDVHTTGPMMIGAWKTPLLTLADRKYAGHIVLDPMVWVVKADAPWSSLRELSTWVKTNPEQLIWGSVGPSGPSRYTAFDWFSQIGVDPVKTKMVLISVSSSRRRPI